MSSSSSNKFLRAAQEMNLRAPIPQPEAQSQQFIHQPINTPPVSANNPSNQYYQGYQQNIPIPQPQVDVNQINEGVSCPPQPPGGVYPINEAATYPQQSYNPPQPVYAYIPPNQVQNPDEDMANMLLDELDQFTKQILSLPYKAQPNPEIEKRFPYATPTSEIQAERALFTS